MDHSTKIEDLNADDKSKSRTKSYRMSKESMKELVMLEKLNEHAQKSRKLEIENSIIVASLGLVMLMWLLRAIFRALQFFALLFLDYSGTL